VQLRDRVVLQVVRRAVAGVLAGQEAHDDRGARFGDLRQDLVARVAAGHVDGARASREARAYDVDVVGLHRRGDALGGQCLDDRHQLLDLRLGVDAAGVAAAGLSADVDDVRALGRLHARLACGGLAGQRN